jgi:hypothetical protein
MGAVWRLFDGPQASHFYTRSILQVHHGFVLVRVVAQARRRSTLFASVPVACAAPYPSGASAGCDRRLYGLSPLLPMKPRDGLAVTKRSRS